VFHLGRFLISTFIKFFNRCGPHSIHNGFGLGEFLGKRGLHFLFIKT
jgi:hypothetical protein